MIGSRIRSARKRRARSQKWLADQVGVSQPSVSDWESGNTDPTTDNMSAIARVLEVGYDWLATGRGEMEYSSVAAAPPIVQASPEDRVPPPQPDPVPAPTREELSQLTSIFKRLSLSQRAAVLSFLESFCGPETDRRK